MKKAIAYTIYFQPYTTRSEHCAIGVIVKTEDGVVSPYFAKNLRKIEALDPRADTNQILSEINSICSKMSKSKEDFEMFLNGIGYLKFSSDPGGFKYENEKDFHRSIDLLKNISIEPNSSPKHSRPRSRLFKNIEQGFIKRNLLSTNPEDIHLHKVVPKFLIREDGNVKTDFAFMNGVFRNFEVIDLTRTKGRSYKQREVFSKAITCDIAKKEYPGAVSTIIISCKDEQRFRGDIRILKDYSQIARFESNEDMLNIYQELQRLSQHPH